MSYYGARGDFLSDIGGGISKVSGFASLIPGVGTAVSAVGGLLGGGISAIGSLFGGGGPPPMSDAQFSSALAGVNSITNFLIKNTPPQTSPGPPISATSQFIPETEPPARQAFSASPELDYSEFEEEDFF